MRKTRTSLVAVAAVATLVLSACSQDNGGTETTAPAPPAQETTEAAPPAEETTEAPEAEETT
ncbi:MAG: hypothetical protein Q4G64_04085, partial [bacterium]|nr:hypothetical protein [bacterium]